jgi:hypothetical protein
MLVSHTQKFLFVHIQKTGGSTIKTLLADRIGDLEQVGASHSPLREASGIGDDYFRFAFVRNPWARLVSWYSMIRDAADYRWYDPYLTISSRRRAWIREHRRQIQTNKLWRYVTATCSSFDGFVRDCTDEVEVFDGVFYSLTRNQVDYLTDESGAIAVDFIGRAERFTEDAERLFSLLDLEIPEIPTVNASDHTHYSHYYTPETAAIVRRRFEPDIEAFGYEFSSADAPVST